MKTMSPHTLKKGLLLELSGVEWRCVLEEDMEQCVMSPGTMRMPLLSADRLVFHLMVSYSYEMVKFNFPHVLSSHACVAPPVSTNGVLLLSKYDFVMWCAK